VKPSEIKDKPEAELLKLAGELKEEVFRLRFRQGTGQLKQTTSIRMTKRDLARVETELSVRRKAQASKEES
jgi:large subunit ribosomal protein L29